MWIDYALLVVLAVSTLVGVSRGFIREVLSLGTWISAFGVAGYFYSYLAPYCAYFQDEVVRNGIAFVALLIVTTLIGGVINALLGKLITHVGLTTTDRVLGVGFGLLRGVLIICALLFAVDLCFSMAEHEAWQHSKLIPHFECLIKWFISYLREEASDLI